MLRKLKSFIHNPKPRKRHTAMPKQQRYSDRSGRFLRAKRCLAEFDDVIFLLAIGLLAYAFKWISRVTAP